MFFIRKELLAKRLEDFETKSWTIYIELLIPNRKLCIIFIYREPKYDKKVFFQESSKAISQSLNKYDYILVAGNLNIYVSESKGLNDNHFFELIETFNLTNLVKTPTCFKKTRGTLLDMLLTNKPNSFKKSFIRVSPKLLNIESIFCDELDQTLLKGEIYKLEDPYSKLTEKFQEMLWKHAPLKSKQVRGNYSPFMNK